MNFLIWRSGCPRWAMMISSLLLIAPSCSKSDAPAQGQAMEKSTKKPVRTKLPAWDRAPETSLVNFRTLTASSHYGQVTRCWRNQNIYDCLLVNEIPNDSEMGSAMFSAFRFQSTRPSSDLAHLDVSRGGYGCQFFSGPMLVNETLNSPHGIIQTNNIDLKQEPVSRPWPADYKIKKLLSYGAPSNTQFDCLELASLVMNSSIASIATEQVSFRQMMH